MSIWQGFRHRLLVLLRGAAYDREMAAELRAHLELEAMQQERSGLSPERAHREARRRLGNPDFYREERRRMTWLRAADRMRQDFTYALRQIRQSPLFTTSVVCSLALGIGANAAMFDIVDRLLLRPPEHLDAAARVHRVYFSNAGFPQFSYTATSHRRYRDLSEFSAGTDVAAGYWSALMPAGQRSDLREARVLAVTPSYWSLFNAAPVLGRFLTVEEDRPPAGSAVVVLSHAYWQTHFGAERNVLGSVLTVGPKQYTVVGVAPRGLTGADATSAAALFVPLSTVAQYVAGGDANDIYSSYRGGWVEVLLRRRADVSKEAFAGALGAAMQRSNNLEASWRARPAPAGTAARLAPVQQERGPVPTGSVKVALWLCGVALAVLLIACANVSNLMIARTLSRQREIAVRIALGVSRARLVMQFAIESIPLLLLSAAAAMLVAHAGGRLLRAMLAPRGEWTPVFTDVRVWTAVLLLTLAAGFVLPLLPALMLRQGHTGAHLRMRGQGEAPPFAHFRSALLIGQTALSIVLLVGAGAFVRSLHNVRSLPLGFDADRVLYAHHDLASEAPPAVAAGKQRLLQRALALPNVVSAARATSVPFWSWRSPQLATPGVDSAALRGAFVMQATTAHYFQTMGTRIVRGRGLSESDVRDSAPVLVVSVAMAQRLWPGGDAIGRCVRVGAVTEPCSVVVGVAANIRMSGLRRDDGLQYYLPLGRFDPAAGGLLLRTRGPADASAAEAVRRALKDEFRTHSCASRR